MQQKYMQINKIIRIFMSFNRFKLKNKNKNPDFSLPKTAAHFWITF